jgi:hypothetical protein
MPIEPPLPDFVAKLLAPLLFMLNEIKGRARTQNHPAAPKIVQAIEDFEKALQNVEKHSAS